MIASAQIGEIAASQLWLKQLKNAKIITINHPYVQRAMEILGERERERGANVNVFSEMKDGVNTRSMVVLFVVGFLCIKKSKEDVSSCKF